jgi:dTDP-4-dehydrorhamnose 3,5-epimerase
MRFVETSLAGVLIVEPRVFRDGRGFFLESYRGDEFAKRAIPPFVQDNHSGSVARTIRGLHLQLRRPQGKLIRVIEGEILDVAADVRRGSATFGQWVAVNLSAANFRECYIPPGFAHGFCVLSDGAQVEYKCTDFYDPAGELSIAWNDPTLGIRWPIDAPILSPRDQRNPTLAAQMDLLPTFRTDL